MRTVVKLIVTAASLLLTWATAVVAEEPVIGVDVPGQSSHG